MICIRCVLTSVFLWSSNAGESKWQKVTVDEAVFVQTSASVWTKLVPRFQCAAICTERPYCGSWCHDGVTCELTSLTTLPSSESGTKTCYADLLNSNSDVTTVTPTIQPTTTEITTIATTETNATLNSTISSTAATYAAPPLMAP